MPWTTLNTLDLEAITDAVNRVFESFIAPIWTSPEQMGAHLTDNQVFLEHSPLWLSEAGEVIGLAALAMRKNHGWIPEDALSFRVRPLDVSIHTVRARSSDLLVKLFSALQRDYREQPLRILNESVDSTLSFYLKHWGWEEVVDQYEMFWENSQWAY